MYMYVCIFVPKRGQMHVFHLVRSNCTRGTLHYSVEEKKKKKEAMQLVCTMHKHPLDTTTLVRFYYRYTKNLLYIIYIRLLYV